MSGRSAMVHLVLVAGFAATAACSGSPPDGLTVTAPTPSPATTVALITPTTPVDPPTSASVPATTTIHEFGSPRYLVGIAGAGHNSFTDSCTTILELGGLESLRFLLGPLVDLAQDGCTPGAVDPHLVQSVLDHYSTAFFLTYLQGDDQVATLEADAVHEFGDISLVAFAAG